MLARYTRRDQSDDLRRQHEGGRNRNCGIQKQPPGIAGQHPVQAGNALLFDRAHQRRHHHQLNRPLQHRGHIHHHTPGEKEGIGDRGGPEKPGNGDRYGNAQHHAQPFQHQHGQHACQRARRGAGGASLMARGTRHRQSPVQAGPQGVHSAISAIAVILLPLPPCVQSDRHAINVNLIRCTFLDSNQTPTIRLMVVLGMK